jgi:hypothetical protein
VAAVHHLIVLPAEVAFSWDVCPLHIVAAVAVTAVGAEGTGLTVTLLLTAAEQPVAVVVTVTVYKVDAATVSAASAP